MGRLTPGKVGAINLSMHSFPARFPGTCTLSKVSFSAGDAIVRTPGGYALASAAAAPAKPVEPAPEPFAGDRIRQTWGGLTQAEQEIDRQVERVLGRYTGAARYGADPLADRAYDNLSPLAKKRFHALCEAHNPYDR